MTAAKSLIEENAEELNPQRTSNLSDVYKVAWPRPYDYFYGALLISPDKKYFLSKGWGWGSADDYRIYDIAHFMNSDRIRDVKVERWEHSTRSACWINDELIAIIYDPFHESDEGSSKNSAKEIHFHKVNRHGVSITKRLPLTFIDSDLDSLYYSKTLNAFILFAKERGLTVFDMEGSVLLQDADFHPTDFYPEFDAFMTVSGNIIAVHQLSTS